MSNSCPNCDADLPAAAINLTEGVALCPGCGQLSRLRAVARTSEVPAPQGPPPRGCRPETNGLETRLVASNRSAGQAAILLFAALFWNSIVSVFVLVVAAGYWIRLAGSLPDWFPMTPAGSAGPERGGEGGSAVAMPLGLLIFMTVFLTPFVAIGLGLIAGVLLAVGGRTEVRLGAGRGSVFTGIGPLGWSRRFDPARVSAIRTSREGSGRRGRRVEYLVIEADRRVRTGSTLTGEQRRWLAKELRGRLLRSRQNG